jgi:glucose-1-phosphatase
MEKDDLSKVKNIIIDMGGVIIDIDYQLTVDAFVKLGISDFDTVFTQVKQLGFIDDFEKGMLSNAEFRNRIRTFCSFSLTDAEIDAAWNALILNLNPARVELVRKLSAHYKLYLLSNNNAIHYQKLKSKIEAQISFDTFSSLFIKNYYSHLIGMRKPDAEVFGMVLAENNLLPSETLFIDDSIQHIKGAEALGIKTLFIQASAPLESYF